MTQHVATRRRLLLGVPGGLGRMGVGDVASARAGVQQVRHRHQPRPDDPLSRDAGVLRRRHYTDRVAGRLRLGVSSRCGPKWRKTCAPSISRQAGRRPTAHPHPAVGVRSPPKPHPTGRVRLPARRRACPILALFLSIHIGKRSHWIRRRPGSTWSFRGIAPKSRPKMVLSVSTRGAQDHTVSSFAVATLAIADSVLWTAPAAGEDDEFGLGIFLCPFTSIDVSFDSVGAIFRSPSITRQRQCPRRE